jgi:SAM-dependent methyltransferase
MLEHHDAPPVKRQRQSLAQLVDWYLYPASRKFSVGSRVFVKPKSAKELGRRGTVVVDDVAPVSTPGDGKIKIQFDDRDNEEKRVVMKRIFPVFSTHTTTCLVTPDTASYRNLASSQLTKSKSVVLEIGCSTGEASVILTNYSQKWMGFDTSDSMVARCKVSLHDDKAKACKVDALADPCRATKLVEEELGSPNVIFLDIGGNRECDGVLRMVDWVLDTFVTKQQQQGLLVVIKSRELHAKLKEEGTTAPDTKGLVNNGSVWIEQQLQRLNRKIPSHPLQAPLRRRHEGYPQPICRYHNYHKNGGCKKHNDGGKCELDHDRCHMCLKEGHIALACPLVMKQDESK